MWLATKYGFYSIVKSKEQENCYMVRARKAIDLKNLRLKKRIHKSNETDYMFRIFINTQELLNLMVKFGSNIDYSNFKDKIAKVKNQKEKVPFYARIWSIMYEFQFKDIDFTYGRYTRYGARQYNR